MALASTEQLSTLPLSDLEARLETTDGGLAQAEAARRMAQYGPNELPEKKENPLLKLLASFWGPIPWMIEAAAVLSLVVRHWADFVIISVLLVVNALVGFWEEFQAGNAVAALKKQLALTAKVMRDGAWTQVPARELVSGDLIRLRLGDVVPADAKLHAGDPIEVDQSALTGESLPVTKRAEDVVYSGSVVKQGEIDALVYGTGADTYFGTTARLVEGAGPTSHFQRAVMKVGDFLILLDAALVLLILMVALFRGDDMLTTVQFALVLTVAAIPVAMPTVLSVTMAVGARVLAQGQAIVSRLAAIEELAGMDILCSDKTGTLTQNRLTLGDPFTVPGVNAEEIILAAALASRAEDQDSIDQAVLSGLKRADGTGEFRILHFQPFDPVHKRTEAEVRGPDGATFRVAKGAPQVILELVGAAADGVRPDVTRAIAGFAARGFRSLGVARTGGGGAWRFLGILPLYDPPRVDSKETIENAERMGVRVKMVTGDQIAIAREIAGQLSLGENILDAGLFDQSKHHEGARLDDAIEGADGFAQVYPEHKYHIVDALQKRRHIVGMTGDGVNDAPALKKADAGIAVSGRHRCRARGGRHRPPHAGTLGGDPTRSRRAERSSSG